MCDCATQQKLVKESRSDQTNASDKMKEIETKPTPINPNQRQQARKSVINKTLTEHN